MTNTTEQKKARKRLGFLVYWVCAAIVIAGLLWQMDRYTKQPGRRNLDQLARVINKQYKPGDAIAFSPHWIGNYSLDRKRYKHTFKPKDLKSVKRLDGRQRAWLVHAFVGRLQVHPPAGYTQKSVRKVGKVYVQLVEKSQGNTP